MKSIISLILIISYQILSASAALDKSLDKISLQIEPNIVIELCAKHITSPDRKRVNGLCIYEGQLWDYAITNPPYCIMVSGHITIEKKKIKLDVTGLATPWIDSKDLTKDKCRLKKYNFGEDDKDYCYILDICFFKGGALDYIVTWLIYQDKSLRTKIMATGDAYPDWYKSDGPQDKLTISHRVQ